MTDHTALIEALERADGPDEIATLVEELREGVRFIGLHDDNNTELFDVAGADEKMSEAAATITALQAEVARKDAQIKTVQRAAKTIMIHEADELARLRKQKQEWHLAIQTLESERAANALLTEQVERLETRAALERTKP